VDVLQLPASTPDPVHDFLGTISKIPAQDALASIRNTEISIQETFIDRFFVSRRYDPES
jgi:hypothetical protein